MQVQYADGSLAEGKTLDFFSSLTRAPKFPITNWRYIKTKRRKSAVTCMPDKTYLVKFKTPALPPYAVVAETAEIQGDHLALVDWLHCS